MMRVAFGLLWFVVFWIGSLVVMGAVVGAMAGVQAAKDKANAPPNASASFDQGYDSGYNAGYELGQKYGGLILLGALVAAVGGTALGILPGTRPRRKELRE